MMRGGAGSSCTVGASPAPDKGIRKDGDCLFTSRDKSRAVCFLVFSRIRMRYSLRVALRNPKSGNEPLALVEAGNVTAAAKSAEASLLVEKHSDGRFHIAALDLGRVKIRKLVFKNSTVKVERKEDSHEGSPVSRPDSTCTLLSRPCLHQRTLARPVEESIRRCMETSLTSVAAYL
ncbi:hypothetical protein MTO96_028006 [Rhipicephalus appendiculatus]